MPRPGPSASAARYLGDDFQLVIALQQAVLALRAEEGIVAIELESASAARGLDDIVVRRQRPPHDFIQTKATMSAKEPLNGALLMRLSDTGGSSLLQLLHAGWRKLESSGISPRLVLATTRSIDPTDPIMRLRDHHGNLAGPLLRVAPNSDASREREVWQEHLGIAEEEMFRFLSALRIDTDGVLDKAKEHLAAYLRLSGYRDDDMAMGALLALARGWVIDGKRALTAEAIAADFRKLDIVTQSPSALLHVDAVDRTQGGALSPTVSIDWLQYYDGTSPGERLAVRDASANVQMIQDLTRAKDTISKLGYKSVAIEGAIHLPHWFAIGATFRVVSDFRVETTRLGLRWAPGLPRIAIPLAPQRTVTFGRGGEVAIAVEISGLIEQEARRYVRESLADVRALTTIARGQILDPIATTGEADSLARIVRDEIRLACVSSRPYRIHLFMQAPAGFALLLGHYWDRLPVQTYEWLGTGNGYSPSIFIPA